MIDDTKPVNDWTTIPFHITTNIGVIASILDFLVLQTLQFQDFAFIGLFLIFIGGYVRIKALFDLREKARFDSVLTTFKLQTLKDQQIVKEGLYKHIRHPVYLGQNILMFGSVIFLSSVYGVFFIAVATLLLLFRIEIEEKMLIERFGEEYIAYQKTTKKLIPYLY